MKEESTTMLPDLKRLVSITSKDEWLVKKGRFVDTSVLLAADDRRFLIRIIDGRVVSVDEGPFVMPSWTFALRSSEEEWGRFWQTEPPPGSNDLFAMMRRKTLVVEGNLQPFMANLLYFKMLLGALRETAA